MDAPPFQSLRTQARCVTSANCSMSPMKFHRGSAHKPRLGSEIFSRPPFEPPRDRITISATSPERTRVRSSSAKNFSQVTQSCRPQSPPRLHGGALGSVHFQVGRSQATDGDAPSVGVELLWHRGTMMAICAVIPSSPLTAPRPHLFRAGRTRGSCSARGLAGAIRVVASVPSWRPTRRLHFPDVDAPEH